MMEKNCNINNFDKNTNYEFRICEYYNDLIGPWSEIQKYKTKNNRSNNPYGYYYY